MAATTTAAIAHDSSTSRAGAAAATGLPGWWSGDCDAGHWNAAAASKGWTGAGAHRLGASYLGVAVCGPRHASDGAPDVLWTRPGWGEYEWECPELAFRFMAQIYGVKAYGANGNNVVRNYRTSAGGGLEVVANGVAGRAPQPGDVMSFDFRGGGPGHVAVVESTSVDQSGYGSVRLITQNDTADGWRTLQVANWTVQRFGDFVPYGWLHDPAGRGQPGQVLPAPFAPFASADAFVSQQGTDFTGGPGTSADREAPARALELRQSTPGQVIEQYLESQSFAGYGAGVVRLYSAYLQRVPDFSGFLHWLEKARAGAPLSDVSNSFALSNEFRSAHVGQTNSAFVQFIYRSVLGRGSDTAGQRYWTSKLDNGMSEGAVMVGFSESLEHRNTTANQTTIALAYLGMLRRPPDSSGNNVWLWNLAAGKPRTDLLQTIATSPEYANRFR